MCVLFVEHDIIYLYWLNSPMAGRLSARLGTCCIRLKVHVQLKWLLHYAR
jgi:hypothetical protein